MCIDKFISVGVSGDSELTLAFIDQVGLLTRAMNLPMSWEKLDQKIELKNNLRVIFIEDENLCPSDAIDYDVHVTAVQPNTSPFTIISPCDTMVILLKVLIAIKNKYAKLLAPSLLTCCLLALLDQIDMESAVLPSQPKLHKPHAQKINTVSQLFFTDQVSGYKRENSITETGKTDIAFNLQHYHFLDIQKLRFDPNNRPCIIYDCKFFVDYESGEKICLDIYSTNASKVKYNKLYFDHNDPQIIFHQDIPSNPKVFHASFKVSSVKNYTNRNYIQLVDEAYQYYINLFMHDNVLGEFCGVKRQTHDLKSGKNIFIILGPHAIGLDYVNNYFLDHVGDLLQKKALYPTHQRMFTDLEGHGSLFALFSKKSSDLLQYDDNKAKYLKQNLIDSRLDTLLLASEDFLRSERLMYCRDTFTNAKYLYYYVDSVYFAFDKYKRDVMFNKETKKFNEYIKTENSQVVQFLEIFKYLAPNNIILKSLDVNNSKYFTQVLEDIFTLNNIKHKFDTSYSINNLLENITTVALECIRLLNYYSILDEELLSFVNEQAFNYTNGKTKFIWLTNEGYDMYLYQIKEKLSLMCQSFGYQTGIDTVKETPKLADYCCEQTVEINEIDKFLMVVKKNDLEKYTDLIKNLQLNHDKTDNAEFNALIKAKVVNV